MGKPVSAVVISTRRCSTTVHILTEADCHDRPLLLQFSACQPGDESCTLVL